MDTTDAGARAGRAGRGGCATIPAREATRTEEILSAAGFAMKPADTPASLAILETLPPRKLVRQQRHGQPAYVYADPDNGKCLYVGNEQHYQKVNELRLERKVADEQLAAAQAADDASLNWGLWGPWAW